MRPRISIVTPSFNQASYLKECLESVAIQASVHLEHIVVDGASTDGSIDILRRAEQGRGGEHLRWTSEPDEGQSQALNKGFRTASGEIVGWLNSDDRYRGGCFESVLKTFDEHPEVDVIYGDYTWINEKGAIQQLRREISFSPLVLMYHPVLFIPTTALFFRRRILDDGFLLNEKLQFAMDYDFLVRLMQSGYRFLHVARFLADFRFQPYSKTCMFPQRQLDETAEVMREYAPALRSCPNEWTATLALRALRVCAAIRRYGEKAGRGYYFTQFRRSAFRSSTQEAAQCEC